MNLRRAAASVFGSSILRNIISFAAVAYFSNELGVAVLGGFFLFQSLLSLCSIPVDLGIRTGVEKRISEGRNPSKTLSTGLTLKLITLLVFLIGIFIFKQQINQYIGEDVAYLFGTALILNELGQLGRHTLRGEHRVSISSLYQPLRTLIWAIGGIFLDYLGFSHVALFWSYLTALCILVLLTTLLVDTKLGKPSLTEAKDLIGYSKFAAVGSVGGLVYNWTDVLIIGVFLSQTAVGAYEIAWRLATVALMLANAVRISAFPQINTWGQSGDINRIESVIESSFIPSFYLVIPIVIGGAIVGDDLLRIWFNVEFPLIHIVLIILLLEKMQRAILLPLIAPMHAIGNVHLGAYTTLLGIGSNIVANFILIPTFGLVGAAVGTTVGAIIKTISHVWLLKKDIKISVPISEISWMVASGVIMGTVAYIAKALFDPISYIELLGIIAFSAIIYGVATLISDSIREEVFNSINSIR